MTNRWGLRNYCNILKISYHFGCIRVINWPVVTLFNFLEHIVPARMAREISRVAFRKNPRFLVFLHYKALKRRAIPFSCSNKITSPISGQIRTFWHVFVKLSYPVSKSWLDTRYFSYIPKGFNIFQHPFLQRMTYFSFPAKFNSHVKGDTKFTRVLVIPGGYRGIPKTRQPYWKGIPISLGIWVWGYPKHGDTQITVTAAPAPSWKINDRLKSGRPD